MPLRENDLHPPAGAKHSRKRIGRGSASGQGTYAGKGLKGQKARSGNDIRPGFEGGQMPMIRKMPHKRGFRAPFRVEYTPINVFRLQERFEANAEVTAESLVHVGLLKNESEPFKVLGNGDLDRPLTVRAPKVSAAARSKIEAAGGNVEELDATIAGIAEPN